MPEPEETTDAQQAALSTYHTDPHLTGNENENRAAEDPPRAFGDEANE